MIACFTKKVWRWECLGILAFYRSHKDSTSNKRGILNEKLLLSHTELASGWTVEGTYFGNKCLPVIIFKTIKR